MFLLLGKEGVRGQFGAIFRSRSCREGPGPLQPIQFPRHPDPGQRVIDHKGQTLPREVSDQRQDVEAAAVRYPRTLKLYVGSVM